MFEHPCAIALAMIRCLLKSNERHIVPTPVCLRAVVAAEPRAPSRPNASFRAVAFAALIAAAIGTMFFMLRVGHTQPLLIVLFAGWDLAPIGAFAIANRRSPGWPPAAESVLHVLTLIAVGASLASYGYVAFGPPRAQPAALFLLVPVGLWASLAIAVLLRTVMSRSRPS